MRLVNSHYGPKGVDAEQSLLVQHLAAPPERPKVAEKRKRNRHRLKAHIHARQEESGSWFPTTSAALPSGPGGIPPWSSVSSESALQS